MSLGKVVGCTSQEGAGGMSGKTTAPWVFMKDHGKSEAVDIEECSDQLQALEYSCQCRVNIESQKAGVAGP